MIQFCRKYNILNRFLILLTFLGSVFLTSEKFVNDQNSPKNYFVLLIILILITFSALGSTSNLITFQGIRSKILLWGISTVCYLQAAYGFVQFQGWLPTNHSKFDITGSFDNPGGFAAVLAIGFPIGLFMLAKAGKVERHLASGGLLVISVAIFLTGSRAGVLAILVSSVVFLLLKSKRMSKFKQLRYLKLLPVLILSIIVSGASILYHQNKDSANGRLLIWKVSLKMIKDKPIFGHGFGAFQAKYMDYQADYFKANQGSSFEILADNVKHPFNEFIKVAVEFGIIGLVIIFSIMLWILWKVLKSENEKRSFVFGGLVSFIVFAFFSYPLQYIAVWFLLAFYLLAALPSIEIRIKNTPIAMATRIIVFVTCVFLLFYFAKQVRAEIKWKTIAENSLIGQTEEMLPEYEELYSTSLKRNPFFLYNYGAELNFAGRFDISIGILKECQQSFNDYDLQMLLADNYHKMGEAEMAIEIYKHASYMIPCRFLPMYQQFDIYRKTGQKNIALKFALEIVNKKVKIPSLTINLFKAEAEEYLKENKSTFGNML